MSGSPWEPAVMLGVLVSLLALLACALWQRWKARRNERTDRLMRRRMASAYRRGMLARHSPLGEVWMDERNQL